MDPLHELTESGPSGAVLVDRTVSWVIAGLGVLLAFALILSTFSHVHRLTGKPSLNGSTPAEIGEAEIGGAY